ncbi:tRNA (adenosine(37)-N6)-threonylcarbamoyltransferase complex transferase subunit TsaD [Candidatus Uhrbacteria bacterium]|nr:tRNA (adenosine(37)-N6)-threonylcarbamoyltransferase complex transferase subunit TsaD [Candidatus Uhrbacteria bacterium]
MNHAVKQFNRRSVAVLGIESSCDETAVAFLKGDEVSFRLLSTAMATQQNIHKEYGGVVPEVAARIHIETIIPLVKRILGRRVPDCVAVTAGPGLITSLLVGVHTARALAYIYGKPLVRVNHIEGHIYSNWLATQKPLIKNQRHRLDRIRFPALALIVSGGHTELILMRDHGKYKKIGKTVDDAAGEAFDKVAKIVDLDYPGGPAIARRAAYGNSLAVPLPIPMLHSRDFNFSFSGLKTAVLYRVRDQKNHKTYSEMFRDDICASFQHSVVTVLVKKTCAAAKHYNVKSVLVGGGVAANIALRQTLAKAIPQLPCQPLLFVAPLKYCTDNAAMIALAGYIQFRRGTFTSPLFCDADPSWELP